MWSSRPDALAEFVMSLAPLEPAATVLPVLAAFVLLEDQMLIPTEVGYQLVRKHHR